MILTQEQKTAIESKSKKILLLSCAGSGKTTVIAERIMRLRKDGVHPEQILVLTFANKASRDMKSKISNYGVDWVGKVNVKTFHAFGLEIIRQYSSIIGFVKPATLAKKAELQKIIKDAFNRKNLVDIEGIDIYDYINKTKSFESYESIPIYDEVLETYTEELNNKNLLDMDDMIYLSVKLLESNDSVRSVLRSKYKYIFVDEYQDTNEAQNRLLELLIGDETNVFLVGDDDQAIYEWRGARSNYIKEKALSNAYECLTLETNFRSQAEIISIANTIINNNKNRVEKQMKPFRESGIKPFYKRLYSEKAESEWVAKTIEDLIISERFNPSDIAVLYRNNDQEFSIKDALLSKNIKSDNLEIDENAKYSSFLNVLQSILDLKSVKDLSEALNFPTRCFDRFAFEDAKKNYLSIYGKENNYDLLEWVDKLYLSNVSFEGGYRVQRKIRNDFPAT